MKSRITTLFVLLLFTGLQLVMAQTTQKKGFIGLFTDIPSY